MKLFDLVIASPALQKLMFQDLPLRTAYEVAQLVDRCNPHLNFYSMELIKAGEDERRIHDLQELNCNGFEDFSPVRIPLSANAQLEPADIKRLEPLVEFVEEAGA